MEVHSLSTVHLILQLLQWKHFGESQRQFQILLLAETSLCSWALWSDIAWSLKQIPGRLFEQPRRSTRLNTGGDLNNVIQQSGTNNGTGPLGQHSGSGGGFAPGLVAGNSGSAGRAGGANPLRLSLSRKTSTSTTDCSIDDGELEMYSPCHDSASSICVSNLMTLE